MVAATLWMAMACRSETTPLTTKHSPPLPTNQTPTADTASGPPTAPTSPPRPNNVLIVLLDDVGIDKIPVYGEHPTPGTVPNLDALAREGMIFRNAWASPACSPSRGALFTGRYGRRYNLGSADPANNSFYEVPIREITIADVLDAAPDGWSTSLVGKWHLASFTSTTNLAHPGLQGFDWYHVNLGNVNETYALLPGNYYQWELVDNGTLVEVHDYVTTHQVDDAIERIQTMPEPWLLVLSLTAAHTPLSYPPPELLSGGTTFSTIPPIDVRYELTLEGADTRSDD